MRPFHRNGLFLVLSAALVFAGALPSGAGSPVAPGLLERIEAARSRGEIDRGKAEFYKLSSLYAPGKIPARLREVPGAALEDLPFDRCGTLVRRSARQSLSLMDAADRAEAESLLALPVVAPEETAAARTLGKAAVHIGAAWAETENFSIEWDATLTNNEDTDADGIPDVVELWASYFERSYAVTVGDMGYTDPLFSVYKVTVFIHALPTGYYGITHEPNEAFPMPVIEVNQDLSFTPANSDPDPIRGAMKVTAAHEFFHVVHFLYLLGNTGWEWREDDWWLENSATWMEDEVYDHVDDYYQFYSGAAAWASYLDEGIPVDVGGLGWTVRAYGGAVFPKYLQQHAGGLASLREIWTLIQSGRRILDGPYCTARDAGGTCTALDPTRRDGALTDFTQGLAGIGWTGQEDIQLGYSAANAVHDYDEGSHFGDPPFGNPISISNAIGPAYLGSQYRRQGGAGAGHAVTLSPADPSGPWGLALALDRLSPDGSSYPLTIARRNASGPVTAQVDLAAVGDDLYAAVDRHVHVNGSQNYSLAVNTATPAGAAPGAVTNLFATPIVGGLRIEWVLPGPSVEGVVVRFRMAGDTNWLSRTLYGSWTEVELGGLADPGATPQPYEVEAFAYDAYGNEGPATALASPATPGTAYDVDPPPAVIVSTGPAGGGGGGGGGGCFLDALGF